MPPKSKEKPAKKEYDPTDLVWITARRTALEAASRVRTPDDIFLKPEGVLQIADIYFDYIMKDVS